ncbi:uncharacterized protein LOC105282795 isoform X2 [Ooceraea biroi]|uniref:uncharacterized protein LOC105282795 isoform X2 n=1 Tax=Ooceraea biroi TaxID=2015173 RepID=UPI0005B863F2|nr:uncharacterized protein LOC105282795 isoform X2 [Ooceraea biroi]
MYPKGKKDTPNRINRPRKRRFHGNRFTNRDSSSDNQESAQSSSAKKLNTSSSADISVNPLHCYKIIEFFHVFGALQDLLICKGCKGKVKFEECGDRGVGFKLVVKCICGRTEINSGPLINTGYEINRRLVLVMRMLGLGREGVNIFCGLMDIGQGLASTVDEEKSSNESHGQPATDFGVSGDGTWKKRGFSSLFGVAVLIGNFTGKIVDMVVKSKYCHECAIWNNKRDSEEFAHWLEEHEANCQTNHDGSAGKMEVDGMKEMFGTSVEKYGVRYVNYIGDGDSKTFKSILDLNPYGDDCTVIKSECVGHVEKRIGTRLRNIKKEKLGGRGKLTDGVIVKLTKNYGLAIRQNIDSVLNMRTAIMASLYHYCSTDDHPRHECCPIGADSWCSWRKAEARGQLDNYTHPKQLISSEIEKHLLPVYQDLSRDDLLQRCLGGYTQNPNESFNSTIWRLAPKHLHCGSKVLEIASFLTAGAFNEGYSSLLRTMQSLEITIGRQCKSFCDNHDDQRKTRQNLRAQENTKEARQARRLSNTQQNEFYEQEEGLLYSCGMAD